MKKITTTLMLALLLGKGNAQLLRPGQSAAALQSVELLNYDKPQLTLSDFKGKVVILNFFNHGCQSNIEDLNKWQALQDQYKARLQFVLICNESKDSTSRFFAQRKKLKMPTIPIITSGRDIWFKFKNDKKPYQVWIDREGKVKNVTGSISLTTKKINALLNNETVVVPDEQLASEMTKVNVAGSSIQPMWRSVISPAQVSGEIWESENSPYNEGKSIRIFKRNSSIAELFKLAYREWDKYNINTPAQLSLEVSDKYKYTSPEDPDLYLEWLADHRYCYELIVPAEKKDDRYNIMQQDLQRYFNVTASIERRKIPTLILVRTTKVDKLKTKGGTAKEQLFPSTARRPINDSLRGINNKPFSTLTEIIASWIRYYKKMPFMDKSGYVGNVDIVLRAISIDPFNEIEFKKDLEQYGLKLIERKEYNDVLVIKEKSSL